MTKLSRDFYNRDVLQVGPDLIGSILVHKSLDGIESRHIVTELELYRGVEDLACHASKGKTPRTSVMFQEGGLVYVYLVYGMHWLLNIVTGEVGNPQAILIRSLHDCSGPGRLTKMLGIGGDYYGEDLTCSSRLWFERGKRLPFEEGPRIGVDYAGDYWKSIPWRYFVTNCDALTFPRKNS